MRNVSDKSCGEIQNKLMQARSWLPWHSVVFPVDTFEIRERLLILFFSGEAEIERRRILKSYGLFVYRDVTLHFQITV